MRQSDYQEMSEKKSGPKPGASESTGVHRMTSVRMKWWGEVRSDWQGFSLLEMLLVAFYVSVLFAETVVWICSLCLRVWRGYD